MSPSTETLVIILSIFLALFLALATALVIYLIILTRQIRRLTTTAEKAVDNIGSIVSGLARIISPMFVIEIISGVLKKIKSKKRRGGRNVEE